MPAALQPLLEPIVVPVTWALIHFLWQGSLIALALAGLLSLLKLRSATARYRLACAALILMVVLPPATVIFEELTNAESQFTERLTPLVGRVDDLILGTVETEEIGELPLVDQTDKSFLLPTVEQLLPWLFTLWLSGVLAFSFINLTSWRKIQQLKHLQVSPVDPRWQNITENLSKNLGLSQPVQLLSSVIVQVPMVIGWLKPIVLIPIGAFAGLTAEQLESILAHELAHIRRRDYLVNLLQVVAETLLFYHPAVWWVSQQIRHERENCCDDIAVTITGSNLVYAQALVCLEELRQQIPRPNVLPDQSGFAMSSTGGSLLHRVRRLAGGQTMLTYRPNRPLLTGVILASLFLIFGSIFSVAINNASAGVAGDAQSSSEDQELADDLYVSINNWSDKYSAGEWRLRSNSEFLRLHLETGTNGNNSSITIRLNDEDLDGLKIGNDQDFTLNREAGTFRFQGDITGDRDRMRGIGEFTFEPSSTFVRDMADLGYESLRDKHIYLLATTNITTGYIKEMADIGYENISRKDLIAMAIHQVTPKVTRRWQKLGYDLSTEDLLAWKIHDVSPDFISDIKQAGFDNISEEDLLAFRIHDITPEYVADLKEMGLGRISAEKALAFRIHNVDAEFVQSIKSSGFDLSPDELLSWRIHDVNPRFISEIKNMGFKNLTKDDLLSFSIHNVDADFLREMSRIGFDDLSADALLSMRIHNVDSDFIRGLRNAGIDGLSTERALSFRIHNVTPEFINSMAEVGYTNIRPNDLLSMRIHNVTPAFVQRLQDKGIKKLSVEDLLAVKIHNIDFE